LAQFQIDSLKLLGVWERCRPTPERHLLISDYYHASQTSMCGCYNPYAVEFLQKSFLRGAPSPAADKKIYISRGKAKYRPSLNEPALEQLLTGSGWDIVHAEELTFAEQTQLFSRAAAVCAPHGAGCTNIVFAPAGCKVLELFADNFLNGCYEALSASAGHDHRHLIFPADRHNRANLDPLTVTDTLRTAGWL
jgi:capsular polysaccharide biosynthesis protein